MEQLALMMLNKQQIIELKLVSQEFSEQSLRTAGYDLRISKLMDKKGDSEEKLEVSCDDIDLMPQGIAAVISKEVLKLPPHVCAYASVKTSLCREGVLPINVGVVDPGWEGPLSSLLLNFGKAPYRLRAGDVFLRLTFHFIEPTDAKLPPPLSRPHYEREIAQKFKKRLASSFMDMEAAAKKGSERFAKDLRITVLGYVPIAALMLAALTFFVNFGTLKLANWTTPSEMVLARAKALTSEIEKKQITSDQENQHLKQEVDDLKKQIEALKAEPTHKAH